MRPGSHRSVHRQRSAVLCRSKGRGGGLLTPGSRPCHSCYLCRSGGYGPMFCYSVFGAVQEVQGSHGPTCNFVRCSIHPGVLGAAMASIQDKPAHLSTDITCLISANVIWINSVNSEGMHAQCIGVQDTEALNEHLRPIYEKAQM